MVHYAAGMQAGWMHLFMLVRPDSDATICMSQFKSRRFRPGDIFQSSIFRFWPFCVNCSLTFLFLADSRGPWCGLLLQPPSLKIPRVVAPEVQLEPVRPVSSDLSHQQGTVECCLGPVSVNTADVCVQTHLNPLSAPL